MKADALRGHLDPLILAVVEREPLHGYAIMEALQERSGGELDLPTGTVYPALRRLERPATSAAPGPTRAAAAGVPTSSRRPGRKALARQREEWRTFAQP